MRPLTLFRPRAAALAGLGAGLALAGAARADDQITYELNQTIGVGGVSGEIITDGKIGTLAETDILGWNLTVKGSGATISLSSSGGQSAVRIGGGDLTATSTQLFFNFSGADRGYLLFQSNSPGLFSGAKYFCDAEDASVCFKGAAAVPVTFSDATTVVDSTLSGNVLIATAGAGGGPGGGPIGGPSISPLDVLNSIQAQIDARTAQQINAQLFSQILLGQNDQVSGCDCGGGSASFGSLDLSAHGRYALGQEWTVLGGVQLGRYRERGADVGLNTGLAAALQYDPAGMGSSRPYAEAGVSASYQRTTYRRSYPDGNGGTALGEGRSDGAEVSAFATLGWVDRVTPRDEVAAYVSYARLWQIVGGYTETGVDNPLGATEPGGTDITDVASVGAQFTHMIGHRIELNLNGAVEWAFNSQSGLRAQVADLAISGGSRSLLYYEVGGRISWRLSHRLTGDLFVNGILAPHAVGASAHGGVGFRWAF